MKKLAGLVHGGQSSIEENFSTMQFLAEVIHTIYVI